MKKILRTNPASKAKARCFLAPRFQRSLKGFIGEAELARIVHKKSGKRTNLNRQPIERS
jgi:hypothetical protein